MPTFLRMVKLLLVATLVHLVSACAPKVGSPEWCKSIEEKPKGELTMNEAKDYAKHCVFK
ncbi:DUF3012 domain-containing protein [Cellvibrio sp.]|jgi:Protein of unknown function (DUF3012)